jgi:hypothetical protein
MTCHATRTLTISTCETTPTTKPSQLVKQPTTKPSEQGKDVPHADALVRAELTQY